MKVENIPSAEMHDLLVGASIGHLGCAREGRPYVVPMHYSYDGKELYFFATEGMKTQFMNGNPQVCLQVEDITDNSNWRSVMIIGRAERLIKKGEIERALTQITERNPSLASVIGSARIGTGDPAAIALYRIQPEIIDGRKTTTDQTTNGRNG